MSKVGSNRRHFKFAQTQELQIQFLILAFIDQSTALSQTEKTGSISCRLLKK